MAGPPLRAASAAAAGMRVPTSVAASTCDRAALGRAGAAGVSQLMKTQDVTIGQLAGTDQFASTSGTAVPTTSASRVRAGAAAGGIVDGEPKVEDREEGGDVGGQRCAVTQLRSRRGPTHAKRARARVLSSHPRAPNCTREDTSNASVSGVSAAQI
jgi:hypothetical protein